MQNIIHNVSTVCFRKFHRWDNCGSAMPHHRLLWNPTDDALIQYSGQTIRMRKDHLYLTSAYTSYKTWCERPFVHFHIHFYLNKTYTPGVYALKKDPLSSKLIKQIMQRPNGDHADTSRTEVQLSVFSLLLHTLQKLDPSGFSDEAPDSRIVAVLHYIERNLGATLDNSTLAKVAGQHPNAFIRTFKRIYTVSPQRYVTWRRCERAEQQLVDTQDSLDTIAERNGFCDRYHFSRVFKQVYNCPPAEHRRRLRAG